MGGGTRRTVRGALGPENPSRHAGCLEGRKPFPEAGAGQPGSNNHATVRGASTNHRYQRNYIYIQQFTLYRVVAGDRSAPARSVRKPTGSRSEPNKCDRSPMRCYVGPR